jgi:RNA polymerase sigma-70 factor (ECF subfamily)
VNRPRTEPDAELAALYARACPRLVGLLICIGATPADAEEVAQDAFVKLITRWDAIRGYDDPQAWVRAVAVRMLISRLRRARVARQGLRRLAGLGRAVDHPPPAPDAVDLAAALRTLPPAHRAVLVLHHALDLPVERIAADLGVPAGTVKSRLARARSALAPLLGDADNSRDEEVADHA